MRVVIGYISPGTREMIQAMAESGALCEEALYEYEELDPDLPEPMLGPVSSTPSRPAAQDFRSCMQPHRTVLGQISH